MPKFRQPAAGKPNFEVNQLAGRYNESDDSTGIVAELLVVLLRKRFKATVANAAITGAFGRSGPLVFAGQIASDARR